MYRPEYLPASKRQALHGRAMLAEMDQGPIARRLPSLLTKAGFWERRANKADIKAEQLTAAFERVLQSEPARNFFGALYHRASSFEGSSRNRLNFGGRKEYSDFPDY